SPWLQKDIILIEKVQRKATKIFGPIKHLSYEDRLAYLGLSTLKQRRERVDMIEYFKLINYYYNVDTNEFFLFANKNYQIRGH
ncbi:uncharacterized protein B4U79_03521, partial [Dinothrombium tinctorium]